MFLLNVRCLNNKKIDILQVDIQKYKLKVLCLTETWTCPDSIGYLKFGDFLLASAYCRDTRGGGVAIYCRRGERATAVDLEQFCRPGEIEVCCVKWHVRAEITVFVVTVYRSPTSNLGQSMGLLECVLSYLYSIDECFRVVLCGDFNVDSLRAGTDFGVLSTFLQGFNLSKQNDAPTRCFGRTSTCIDHIYTSNVQVRECVTEPNAVSDHDTVLCSVNVGGFAEKVAFLLRKRRLFSDNNVMNFCLCLRDESWEGMLAPSQSTVSELFGSFHEIFMFHFESCFPMVESKIRGEGGQCWENDGDILASARRLRDLHSVQKRYPSMRCHYENVKIQHSALISNKKKQFYQQKIMAASNPCRAAWRVIAGAGTPTVSHENVSIISEDGLVSAPQSVADTFNDFFVSEPMRLTKSFANSNGSGTVPFTHLANTLYGDDDSPAYTNIQIFQVALTTPSTSTLYSYSCHWPHWSLAL